MPPSTAVIEILAEAKIAVDLAGKLKMIVKAARVYCGNTESGF